MKGLYRGFCRNEQGTETIAINGEKIKGEWVQGFLATECHIIDDTDSFTYYGNGGMDGFAKLVIPETVGQYTGLTDKNGKRIWENDIVLIEYETTTVKGYIKYQGASFYVATSSDLWDINDYCSIRKIGNVYDNPELLKGGVENG